MRFVIVTGMSGAGKTTVLKALEDSGYFCVDNLPVPLITKFVELSSDNEFNNDKVAIGIDIRSGSALGELSEILNNLRESKFNYEILYLDASNRSLVRRYRETRREHPLAQGGNLNDGIDEERSRIEFLSKLADYTIDTSGLLTRELKREVLKIFANGKEYNNMIVTIMSFGYKFGIPQDADYVFDVRFMPNPYYEETLRRKTGNDQEVRDYVMDSKESGKFLDMLEEMMKFLVKENTEKEDRHQLVVAIGCTGGRHRSVTVANELYERMSDMPYSFRVFHRDIINDSYVKGEL
ncbi:MAG: RNase adapter RapZ [Eubacterium sp.]|nr:RNase adapter RapZ [Eubacterium sp.]